MKIASLRGTSIRRLMLADCDSDHCLHDRRGFVKLCAGSIALAVAGACRETEMGASARSSTLIIGIDGPINNNYKPICPDFAGESLVFLPLVRENELTGDRRGCLAAGWERSADHREWTYHLRTGVRWHDGRPVTMDDVEFTLKLHSRPDSPYWGPSLIQTLTVHDGSSFTVRGAEWSDSAVSILPKHLLKDLDYQKFYDWDFWERPVGNGPYRYSRDLPHTMVELEANADYFKGEPRIPRVVLRFAGQSGVTELRSGNVDAIQLDPAHVRGIASDSRFRTYWEPNPSRSWALVWQNQHPFFRDRQTRRALSLAINRRELLQVLGLPAQLSLVDGVNSIRQFRRGQLAEPRYDVAEAMRLLDEAGWRQSRGGMRERDGHGFHFTALTLAESPGDQAALYVQDQLRRLGVRMELQRLERSALLDRLHAGKFEAIVTFLLMGARHAEKWTAGAGYRDSRLARLFQVAATAADPEVEDGAYREISDLVRADQPVAFLFRAADAHVVHRRVRGLVDSRQANPLLFAEELWLE
ncbi:MAG: ABC transporter substrate-binding protein [Gemmatimonadaceae bacterium]